MAVFRVQLMGCVFSVVLLDFRCPRFLQQVISVGHLLAERTQDLVSSLGVLDDGPGLLILFGFGIGGDGEVMAVEAGVLAELGLLGVDEN